MVYRFRCYSVTINRAYFLFPDCIYPFISNNQCGRNRTFSILPLVEAAIPPREMKKHTVGSSALILRELETGISILHEE